MKCSAPPRCPIVAMGASAGGLEVFQQFFDRMPPDSGVAFVLVQHLDPTHDTLMAELLANHTAMKVLMVEDGLKLQANHVYVIAPNVSLSIDGCTLRTGPLPQIADRKLIDQFFRSLADEQHENVIGIILSGTGSDGTLGLKAIKEQGGLTIAQSPETAKFDSMPRQVIISGFVDHVMAVPDMPGRIVEYIKHLDSLHHRNGAEEIQQEAARYLPKIFPLLRKKTGHDFSRYKQSTLVRRIQRRMQVVYLDSVSKYVQHLRENPEEVELLFKDLLIGVTQFFRDAESFEALAKKVIPGMFEEKAQECQVRIWVPGCASGEEAYSFAILLAEHAENRAEVPRIQVFATDLDAEALEFARKARYPADVAQQISPERLQRFFKKIGSNYEVIDEIREMCIFSPHNLIKDPPFSRLDLISCRNLLIYLEADLQKKLLPLFHYALNPCGHLFLGPSENVASRSELFRAVDPKHRIFQRKPTLLHSPIHVPLIDPGHVTKMHLAASAAVTIPKEQSLARSIERVILEEFAPASVVINEQAEVLYFSGNTGKFLEPPAGVPSNKIVAMARKNLRLEVRSAVHRAISTGKEIIRENLALKLGREVAQINLIVRPLVELGNEPELYVVIFQELIPGTSVPRTPAENFADQEHPVIKQLENELRTTKDDLQTTIEELETSNEELKSANEELLSMNEELQSGNEELQTSKEELQSANDELHRKIEEVDLGNRSLAESEDRYRTLFRSVSVGLFVCDRNAVIQYYNQRAIELWGREPKCGVEKHCGSMKLFLPDGRLLPHAQSPMMEVLRTGIPVKNVEVFIERPDGSRIPVIVNFSGLKDEKGEVVGAVTSFDDISERKKGEDALRRSEQFNRSIIDSSRDCIKILDLEGNLLSMGDGGRKILCLPDIRPYLNKSWIDFWHGEERKAARDAVQKAARGGSGNFVGNFVIQSGESKWFDVLITPILDASGKPEKLLAVSRDVTARKLTEDALRRSEKLLSDFFENAAVGLHWVGPDGKIIRANRTELELLGYAEEEYIGHHIAEFHADAPVINDILKRLTCGETLHSYEARLRCKDGSIRHVLISSNVLWEGDKFIHTRCFTRDITQQRLAQDALRQSEEKLRAIFNQAAVGVATAFLDGRFEQVNQKLCNLLGYSATELCQQTFHSITHPDDLQKTDGMTRRLLGGEISEFAYEKRYVRKDGSPVWCLATITLLKDAEGKAIRYIGVLEDISERKEAEENLKAETRVLELLNKTGIAIGSELDLQSLVQTVTDAGRELSGAKFGAFFYTTKDEKGDALLLYTLSGAPREAFDKFGHPRATPVFAPTFKGEGPVRSGDITQDPRYGKMAPHHGMPKGHLPVRSYLAVPVISRSGESIGGLFYGHPEPDVFTERSERLLVGIAAQAAIAIDNARLFQTAQREIAERKRSEEALSRLAAVVESSDDAIISKTLEGIITTWNKGAERMYGYTAEEVIGKPVTILIPPEMPDEEPGIIARLKQGIKIDHYETVRVRKDGTFLNVALTVSPIRNSAGQITGASKIARDITERKRAEAELQKAKEELEQRVLERTASLQETTGQLEAFCYTIAHDLRSPLRAQQSFAQVLLEDYKNVMDDAGREYAQRIINSAKRLDQLVNDLLTYSRLSRADLKFEKVELNKVVKAIQTHLAVEIENQHATISVGSLLSVSAYEPTLNLVITNLITNALKFVQPGESPRIHIFSEPREEFVRLWVEDSGIGISPENREKIFGVFERLHPMEKYPGTGIGLAIVEKGVERMGGRVGIESELGKGSRFWIELPKG